MAAVLAPPEGFATGGRHSDVPETRSGELCARASRVLVLSIPFHDSCSLTVGHPPLSCFPKNEPDARAAPGLTFSIELALRVEEVAGARRGGDLGEGGRWRRGGEQGVGEQGDSSTLPPLGEDLRSGEVNKMNRPNDNIIHLQEAVAESPNKNPRARWEDAEVRLFCAYAAEAVEKKWIAAGSLNKVGWKHVWTNFVARYGKKYTMIQFKNKWRTLSKQFKLWKKLLGSTTGIGWDDEMGTLLADDDWWRSRIEENPELKTIRTQTMAHYRELERVFAPLKDFSHAGRAAADFVSQSQSMGTEATGCDPENIEISQGSIGGGINSNNAPASEHMENEANVRRDGTPPIGCAGPSSSRSSRLARSLFSTPEFSCREKRKSRSKDREDKHMDRMVAYLTTDAKTELEQYGQYIRDPTDLGTVMKAVAELPDYTFGGEYWMDALKYFETHDRACASFLRACTTTETKLLYLKQALGK